MKIGYARVSTTEQNLDIQLKELKNAGCEKIYREKISGTHLNRPELTRIPKTQATFSCVFPWILPSNSIDTPWILNR